MLPICYLLPKPYFSISESGKFDLYHTPVPRVHRWWEDVVGAEADFIDQCGRTEPCRG